MATSSTNEKFSDTDSDIDSGISINGQNEVEELDRLLKERSQDNENPSWKLGWSPLGGRGVIAKCNISIGEVVFTDSPVVLGPRAGMEGEAICVSCFQSGVHLKPCFRGCRLPICSSLCQDNHSNSPECNLLLKLGVEEGDSWSPVLYRALTPFRCITLPEKEKALIKMLQTHPAYEIAVEIKLLQQGIKSDLSDNDKHLMGFCSRVLDTAGFQVVSDEFDSKQSPIRGLFPLAGLINHSCSPNARQIFDSSHRLKLIAVKPIQNDEEITISYCPLLWATPVRINFLLKTKHFICSCPRCFSSTEMGTYLAGLKCDCGGMVLPIDPQEPMSEWKCNFCTRSLSCMQALTISNVLLSYPGKPICKLSLTKNNHLMIDRTLKTIFSQRSKLKDLDETELIDRENKIKHILQVINQLELGECRTKGLLLTELLRTSKERQSLITVKNN